MRVAQRGQGPTRSAPGRIPAGWIAGLLLGLLVLLGGGWAVTTSGSRSNAPASALGPIKSTGATGSLQFVLTLNPDPPRPGPNTLTLQVQTAQGQPLPGAQVRWSMDMTNMNMGPQGGQMTDLGAGKYQTRAQFSMGGPWRITVNVTQAGQALGTGFFDLQIR